MAYLAIEINLPPAYTEADLKSAISGVVKSDKFSYRIERKSLDARKKSNIHWQLKIAVECDGPGNDAPDDNKLIIPHSRRAETIAVVGSGPAGFFSAFVLAKAGFNVTLIERGSAVGPRKQGIEEFERTGKFNPRANYAFGEGGAGTFSDGKLTSRSKNISREKKFFFDSYIRAGAPEEISWLAMPHVGSDKLTKIVANLREEFLADGGRFQFETRMTSMKKHGRKIISIDTDSGAIEADFFVLATGNSAYDTYRMLINAGIGFTVKPFAIGMRVEHPQVLINKSQWGKPAIPGLKAAEYKLTWQDKSGAGVYSFCMCPGGKIVPATAFEGLNIVNGMSCYSRSLPNANAAIVAGTDLARLLRKEVEPAEALDYVESLERKFYDISGSYRAPAMLIKNFCQKKLNGRLPATSYPFGIFEYDFGELLPNGIINPIRQAMPSFENKIKGFEEGVIIGLESKTSSPLRASRDITGRSLSADNLWICGEGSGYSGGIVSSAADGIKAAFSIIESCP